MIEQGVRQERTGWRDIGLSAQHRAWGFDVPCVDIDFLLLEYDRGEPSALIEFKHENARLVNLAHPSYLALSTLGTRAGIPVFVVRYGNGYGWFKTQSVNELAQRLLPSVATMTQHEWVTFLYRLRGREVPTGVLSSLERVV